MTIFLNSQFFFFTEVNINQIVRMILHILNIFCILNPFFTEMPTRGLGGQGGREGNLVNKYAPSRKYSCHSELCKSHFLCLGIPCVYNHVNMIVFIRLQNNPGEWIANMKQSYYGFNIIANGNDTFFSLIRVLWQHGSAAVSLCLVPA